MKQINKEIESFYSNLLETNLSNPVDFDTIEWNFIHKCIELYNFGPNIRKWISILYKNVESSVVNAGFMTNYLKVSRGVRQGCPLSPFLFVLAVELLAPKIYQDQSCRGTELPNGQNAKISKFADDATLILQDTKSLRNAMSIVNSFEVLPSGLQLSKKKTKALWIGTSRKKNKTESLEFKCSKKEILLHLEQKLITLNFLSVYHKESNGFTRFGATKGST